MVNDAMVIYFAAPLFTDAERRWNGLLVGELERTGLRVSLPQREASSLMVPGMPFPTRNIFLQALGNIDSCDCVVAVLDGGDPDSGTSFECGYAHAKGKPIVAVRTDLRAGGDGNGGVNLMLSESAGVVVGHKLDAEVPVLAREVGRAIADVCSAVRAKTSKTQDVNGSDDASRKAKEAGGSGLIASGRESARD